MHRITALATLVLALTIFAVGAASAQDKVAMANPAVSSSDSPVEPRSFPYTQTGSGCAAGAVLGSVVPGLGTAVGCLVGALVGWWRA